MELADVLLSPRIEGANTPLKIYSYLTSGKPIVATDLPTHRQVLSPEIAKLVPADPAALAEGILEILTDPVRARSLGERGKHVVEAKYGLGQYMERLAAILARTAPSGEA
jgi:glycosyltransferase involved in cell wall biosynthesis